MNTPMLLFIKCTKNESSSHVLYETLNFNIKNTIATCSLRKKQNISVILSSFRNTPTSGSSGHKKWENSNRR